MNIQTISKEKKEVMVELTADDLGIICNVLYAQLGEKKHNDTFMQLYSDMMMARDLCQYGHVDDFCLHNIVKCRSRFRGVLSEEDIETFNKYLENNDLPTAFGNSDFVRIYKRIVGDFAYTSCVAISLCRKVLLINATITFQRSTFRFIFLILL